MVEKNLEQSATLALPSTTVAGLPLGQLLRVWISIGLQSFGGGPSTIFLIRDQFIYKLRLLTEDDYARYWVLVQLCPGINIVALTVLIGKRAAGGWGIVASMLGLLVPSATITTLLAAGYDSIQNWPPIQAMLRGVTPATAGITCLVAVQFVIPLLKKASQESRASLLLSVGIVGLCAVLVGLVQLPVVFVLLSAAVVGAIGFSWVWARTSKKPQTAQIGQNKQIENEGVK